MHNLLTLLLLALPYPTRAQTIPYDVTDTAAQETAEYLDQEIRKVKNSVASVPTGAVFWVATSTVPTGYLEGNGGAVSRTTYASLFNVTGTAFGAGDGSTTFNVIDCRGEFIRGWDHGRGADPNAATRSRWDGAVGDVVGSTQSSISPTITIYDSGGDTVDRIIAGVSNNATARSAATSAGFTGTETRPRNIYLMCIIKY